MRKRDNYNAINELRENLHKIKKLTLEHFVIPEDEEEPYGDEGRYGNEEVLRKDGDFEGGNEGIADIEKELIQIRKIALSVINRLADQTSSESYDTMKRIWSLVDKAIESKNDEDKQGNNMRNRM